MDFPAAWREEAGLDSILQTAGRCNREGKRPAQESIVTVFRLNGQRTPAMIRQNVDSTRRVLALFADPSTPEAIESYFSFYRTLKGDDALDRQNVLSAFNKGLQGRSFPFVSVAEQFHLIDSGTATVYLPVDEGAQLTESLRRGAGKPYPVPAVGAVRRQRIPGPSAKAAERPGRWKPLATICTSSPIFACTTARRAFPWI